MKQISDLKDFATDDRGVSPVIGVILMVAITVILAAVIASFVLGFGSSVSTNASAGIDVAALNDTHADVTVVSMGDNTDRVVCIESDGGVNDSAGNASSVGATITCGVGENVVAVGSGNANNATIRTDIGN